jgi:hypothetical protein
MLILILIPDFSELPFRIKIQKNIHLELEFTIESSFFLSSSILNLISRILNQIPNTSDLF